MPEVLDIYPYSLNLSTWGVWIFQLPFQPNDLPSNHVENIQHETDEPAQHTAGHLTDDSVIQLLPVHYPCFYALQYHLVLLDGSAATFFTRPIALVFLVMTVLVTLFPALIQLWRKRK
jgi:hypothetical protein